MTLAFYWQVSWELLRQKQKDVMAEDLMKHQREGQTGWIICLLPLSLENRVRQLPVRAEDLAFKSEWELKGPPDITHTTSCSVKEQLLIAVKWECAYSCAPETPGAGPHGWRSPPVLVRDALWTEVFGEEVQLVRGGLEGQLVQLLLRWTWWLWEAEREGLQGQKALHRLPWLSIKCLRWWSVV